MYRPRQTLRPLGTQRIRNVARGNRESGSEGVKTEQIEEACRVGAARVFVEERCTNVLNPFGGGKRVNRFRTCVGFGQEDQDHKRIHYAEYAADKKRQCWVAKSTR